MIPIPQTVVKDGDSPELPAGFELMNYVIESKLGAGGFSMTYLATEKLSGRAVVIKENFPFECTHRNTTSLQVGPAGAERKELFEWALKRFVDEARVLIKLNHPNIVSVLNVFEAMGTAYYVMPLVSGAVLDVAAPAPGKIDEAWLSPLLQKLLISLDYLHGEGLLHRDIKPSNIILREDGSPILIDFGTSRSSDATHTLTRIGTSGYSPAEQFMAHGKNGPWTDLYSLGATCYRLITGKAPQDAVERLADDELPLLADCSDLRKRFSAKFLAAIDKSLRMARRERWQSAREWLEELVGSCPQEKTEAVEKGQSTSVEMSSGDIADNGRSFNTGRAILFAIIASVSALAGGAILLAIVAAIYWGIRGSKVGKTLSYIMLSIFACAALGVVLFVLLYTIIDNGVSMSVIPGAISLGAFAAIYQYLKGESAGRVFGYLLIGLVGGAIFGYVYTVTLVELYAGMFSDPVEDSVIARFAEAVVLSLFAASVSALIGGFEKRN